MMRIAIGQSNTVVLTLFEAQTLNNPYFLFALKHDQSKQEYYFIAADTSEFPYRYNLFSITEKANPNPLNGEISLPHDGSYTYTIYEQTDPANLDPANATGVVEIGKCKVVSSQAATPAYDSQDKTYSIYKG